MNQTESTSTTHDTDLVGKMDSNDENDNTGSMMGLKLVILAWVIRAWVDDDTKTRARTILRDARTMLDNRRSSL